MDIPRIFNIAESAHLIHNPFTSEKLATLGAALRMEKGTRILDLASGSGEMLCTWARDYGIIGTGIDLSQLYTKQAKLRAEKLGVADKVRFIHGDATGYVSKEKVDVAACVGATWIAGGAMGTVRLLAQSLRPGGIILIGEPYWHKGITPRAVNLICEYGFRELDIIKIFSGVFSFNTASQRVLEKCGFTLEAVLKAAVIKNGKICDEYRYARILDGYK